MKIRRIFTEEDDLAATDLEIRATILMADLQNVVGEMTKLLRVDDNEEEA
jgi:hypothetical protein